MYMGQRNLHTLWYYSKAYTCVVINPFTHQVHGTVYVVQCYASQLSTGKSVEIGIGSKVLNQVRLSR